MWPAYWLKDGMIAQAEGSGSNEDMRIGDLEYISKSKLPAGQKDTEGLQAIKMPELTQKQQQWKKWKNWWYYYKWYVICSVILLGIIVNVIGNYLGLWTKAPDLQVAYVGKGQLPEDTVSALEDAFASVVSDYNGDGEIVVRINQYILGLNSSDPEMAQYEYASELSLIGDISECESYLFLMDDPEQFQRKYQLIAAVDGSCPEDTDFSMGEKVIPWSACPLLAEMDLGGYSTSMPGREITGSNQDLLAGLFIGRRCFFTEDRPDYVDECEELWDTLYEGSVN